MSVYRLPDSEQLAALHERIKASARVIRQPASDDTRRAAVATNKPGRPRIKPEDRKPRKSQRKSAPEEIFALQLEADEVFPHEREYLFAKPDRKWRFDFAWPSLKVALEVEGGIYVSGRHSRGLGMEADMEKYADAAVRGWRVIRVSPRQIKSGDALRWVKGALACGPAPADMLGAL